MQSCNGIQSTFFRIRDFNMGNSVGAYMGTVKIPLKIGAVIRERRIALKCIMQKCFMISDLEIFQG